MIYEMTIGQIGNMACRELPEWWELCIRLENGAALVDLFDPLGEKKGVFELGEDQSLEQAVIEAVNYAKNHDKDYQ